MNEQATSYVGLLMIGDPHLEGRPPGFRKDDYPEVILEKLAWCLDYAARNRLLPALLGDLFDKPRDNPNWMLGRLLDLFQGEILGLYGNHDVYQNPELTDHDSLSLLVKSGRVRLLTADEPWRGVIAERPIIVGGSSYRMPLPDRFDAAVHAANGVAPLVIWLTHHDILMPGYDKGWLKPAEIDGVDLVINGHIHRRMPDVSAGKTLWLTPGNISRRSRSEATREHIPAVLRIDVTTDDYQLQYVEVPHRPFDEVFYEAVLEAPAEREGSAFVAGLAELQSRRTSSGAGLLEFLQQNVTQFEPDVAEEILVLAGEVASAVESPS